MEQSEKIAKSFEEAMEELQKISQKLETEAVSLETAMENFKQGLGLIKFCKKRLAEAELLIQEVDLSDPDNPVIKTKEGRES